MSPYRSLLPGLVLLVAADCAAAHEEDRRPINSSAELRDWCMDETAAYLIGKGATPMNWTASYVVRGSTFHVDGKWLVGWDEVTVECDVFAGAQRRYARFKVNDSGS